MGNRRFDQSGSVWWTEAGVEDRRDDDVGVVEDIRPLAGDSELFVLQGRPFMRINRAGTGCAARDDGVQHTDVGIMRTRSIAVRWIVYAQWILQLCHEGIERGGGIRIDCTPGISGCLGHDNIRQPWRASAGRAGSPAFQAPR